MEKMNSVPVASAVGVFDIKPDSRNVIIRSKVSHDELLVERADVPDLIEALRISYGLK